MLLIAGLTSCGEMGEFAPPPRWGAPMTTVVSLPPTGTVASTGEGGKPPPTKIDDRLPPQEAVTPMEPDPLNRLTKYPRASPNVVAHVPAAAGMGRFVLKVTMPPAIRADVTVCSP